MDRIKYYLKYKIINEGPLIFTKLNFKRNVTFQPTNKRKFESKVVCMHKYKSIEKQIIEFYKNSLTMGI